MIFFFFYSSVRVRSNNIILYRRFFIKIVEKKKRDIPFLAGQCLRGYKKKKFIHFITMPLYPPAPGGFIFHRYYFVRVSLARAAHIQYNL